MGHRRIALVAWPEGSESGDNRVEGFQSAMRTAGLAVDPRLIKRVENGFLGGKAAGPNCSRHVRSTDRDRHGSGRTRFWGDGRSFRPGLRPGIDVAVTGFDDTPAAAYVWPGLTTVRQPFEEVAEALVNLLVDRLDESRGPAGSAMLMPDWWSGAPPIGAGSMTMSILDLPTGVSTWHVVENRFVPSLAPGRESIFTIANGYLSTSGSFEERTPGEIRATFIQGLFVTPPEELPLLGAVPDWTGVAMTFDGHPFRFGRRPRRVPEKPGHEKWGSRAGIPLAGSESGVVKVSFRRLVSMAQPHLAALEVTLTALTNPLELWLETGIDTAVPSPTFPVWNPCAGAGHRRPGSVSRQKASTAPTGCGVETTVRGPGRLEMIRDPHHHRFTAQTRLWRSGVP